MNGKNPGDAVTPGSNATPGDLFGAGKFMENNPVGDIDHPAGDPVVYAYGPDTAGGAEIPEVGDLYITASVAEYAPDADDTKDW
jgi:hypothetical protein